MIAADRISVIADGALALAHAHKARPPLSVWTPLPHQVPPDGAWLHWLLVSGRGAGKTDAAAHYIDQCARAERIRIAIAAPTLHDARSVCVEGETGLLNANPAIRFNRSTYELFWPNGSRGQLFGAYTPEDAERWRGPQHHLVWADEFAAWRQLDACWDQMRFGLRLGVRPRIVITTTPKPVKRLKLLLKDPSSRVTTASTNDNPYLHPDVRAELMSRYAGTRLGRQELSGELLEDIEGALWQSGWIEGSRVWEMLSGCQRVVVAIDPAATSGEDSDETGLAVAARGQDGDYYLLASEGVRMSPKGWASRALGLFDLHNADRLIAETNNGGEMVISTIRTVRPNAPVTAIHASRGKILRAEPIAALYEQGRVHHVGTFEVLEDQMCSYTGLPGEESPDRMDAAVYALTELAEPGKWDGWAQFVQRDSARTGAK